MKTASDVRMVILSACYNHCITCTQHCVWHCYTWYGATVFFGRGGGGGGTEEWRRGPGDWICLTVTRSPASLLLLPPVPADLARLCSVSPASPGPSLSLVSGAGPHMMHFSLPQLCSTRASDNRSCNKNIQTKN